MARLLRVQFPGAIYHATLRGNNRRVLFHDDKDRKRFLDRLAGYVDEFRVRLYIFCLMSNHVHLVFETPEGNLSEFMQRLQTAYSVYFNLRHGESGHVMDGRYKARLVEGHEYLLKLTRYVHLNPVFIAKIRNLELKERIGALREYRWSSYRSYIGKDRRLGFVEYGPMLGLMRGSQSEKRHEYRKFVESGLAENDSDFKDLLKDSRLAIGGEDFMGKIRELHDELILKHKRREDAALRRTGGRLPIEEILGAVCEELGVGRGEIGRRCRGTWIRPIAAKMLVKYGGLTQRTIAGLMGIGTGVSVSCQIRRLDAEIKQNRELDGRTRRIAAKLDGVVARNTCNECAKL